MRLLLQAISVLAFTAGIILACAGIMALLFRGLLDQNTATFCILLSVCLIAISYLIAWVVNLRRELEKLQERLFPEPSGHSVPSTSSNA